jgi:rSAM/selenodomain-associated transferase 1
MAKYPEPGQVKTRLAATLGPQRACALYRAFVLDLAERLRPLPLEVTWAYWPPTAPFSTLVPGARCRPQEGADLGERMERVMSAALAGGPIPVVVIGADAPHVRLTILTAAVESLRTGADLVLGPAADGGYYLIGLRAPKPELFADVAWSTPTVLAETLGRARRLGLRTRVLPETFDIDSPDDLERLSALLRVGVVDLPRTAALLAGAGAPP